MDSASLAAEHEALVTSVYEYYTTLIDLAYLDTTEVQFPPHAGPGKLALATAQLLAGGVRSDAVDLLQLLPWVTLAARRNAHDEGLSITPMSNAVTYYEVEGKARFFSEVRKHGFDEAGEEVLLPEWALLITVARMRDDTSLIYDIRHKTISELSRGEASVAEIEQSAKPAAEVFARLTQDLHLLEMVPWRTSETPKGFFKRTRVYEQEVSDPNSLARAAQLNFLLTPPYGGGPNDVIAGSRAEAEHLATAVNKSRHNEFWSRRIIFEASGWPNSFDRQTCRQKIDEWEAGVHAIRMQSMITRNFGMMMVGDMENGAVLRDFYKRGAGQYAV
nr:hypothetical protein B0A51_12386 [Rachicladosporium sp. CCFEE 5018]